MVNIDEQFFMQHQKKSSISSEHGENFSELAASLPLDVIAY